MYQVVTRPEWNNGLIMSGFKSLALTWNEALNVAGHSWGDECVIVEAMGNTPLAYFPETHDEDEF